MMRCSDQTRFDGRATASRNRTIERQGNGQFQEQAFIGPSNFGKLAVYGHLLGGPGCGNEMKR